MNSRFHNNSSHVSYIKITKYLYRGTLHREQFALTICNCSDTNFYLETSLELTVTLLTLGTEPKYSHVFPLTPR